jgi:predicted nucleic acid-binding protein
MRLYIDLCVFNRPFDYQGEERVAFETSAFIYLLEKLEKSEHSLVISEALVYENSKNPSEQRRSRVASYFEMAKELITVDGQIVERAKFLRDLGFSDLDALHVSSAEKSKADYFITCDDEIVRVYGRHRSSINVKVASLIEFMGLEVK